MSINVFPPAGGTLNKLDCLPLTLIDSRSSIIDTPINLVDVEGEGYIEHVMMTSSNLLCRLIVEIDGVEVFNAVSESITRPIGFSSFDMSNINSGGDIALLTSSGTYLSPTRSIDSVSTYAKPFPYVGGVNGAFCVNSGGVKFKKSLKISIIGTVVSDIRTVIAGGVA